jgi:hypothetical protein
VRAALVAEIEWREWAVIEESDTIEVLGEILSRGADLIGEIGMKWMLLALIESAIRGTFEQRKTAVRYFVRISDRLSGPALAACAGNGMVAAVGELSQEADEVSTEIVALLTKLVRACVESGVAAEILDQLQGIEALGLGEGDLPRWIQLAYEAVELR